MTKHYLTSDPLWKRCSQCKRYYPRTTEYFHKCNHRVDGLNNWCKQCRHEHHVANRERKREYDARYVEINKSRILERSRQYRITHAEEIGIRKRARYKKNRRKILAQQKEAYATRPDIHERVNKTANIAWHRRRARLRHLPDTLTTTQWDAALTYFGGCCAICGRPPGLWHVIAKEHWIPLSDPRQDNPGTVATNILPMCHAVKDGDSGCNNSKSNKDPIEWLNESLGKRKARERLRVIEEYFEWVRASLD